MSHCIITPLYRRVRLVLPMVLFLWLTVGCCHAQSSDPANDNKPVLVPLEPVPIDTSFSFICYDTSHLRFGNDTTAWRRLAKKWHQVTSMRKGHLNIVQIGASHVQGGTFPHRVRRNMLMPFTDFLSDRGMIFPYSAAVKCNNPFDYKVSRSHALELTRNVYKEPLEKLGLCGIAVTAHDSLAVVGMRLCDADLPFTTQRIVLLGESRGGVVPQLQLVTPDTLTLNPTTIDTVLRRYTFELDRSVDSFKILMPCSTGQSFALTGVYLANDAPGVSYHSIGVNGASVSDYLRKCPFLVSDLHMLHPDLVIFCIGINDASGPNFDSVVFKNNYLQLVDSVRAVNPDCAFLFVTNNDSYRRVRKKYSVNTNGLQVRDVFFRLAEATGGAVWDQFAVMGGLRSMETWYQHGLAQRDRIHFTRSGYELLGDMLSNAIFEALRNLKPAEQQVQNDASDSKDLKRRRRNTGDDGDKYLYRRRNGDQTKASDYSTQQDNKQIDNLDSRDEGFRYIYN